MRKKAFFLLFILSLSLQLSSQTKQDIIPFDSDQWQIARGEIVEIMGQKAFKGTATLKDVVFENGIIEVDILFEGPRCFAGINFRMQSPTNYEHFYIRPHKTNLVDALQYTPVFNSVSSWQLYNGEGFTAEAPIPHKEWIHVKLELKGSQGRVFINDMETAAMEMPYLKHGDSRGSIGIFGPGNGIVHFANFSYKSTNDLEFEKAPELKLPEGIISEWLLSQPISFYKIDIEKYPAEQNLELNWSEVKSDNTGLVDIAKITPRSGVEPDVIYAKTIYNSHKEELRPFRVGYSDAVLVFLNGKQVFNGLGYFRLRDPGFQGIAGLNDIVYLPLKKGENEIMIQIIESFGGWGFYFQDAKFRIQDEKITELWQTATNINIPESVVYDKKRERLYVSNYGGFSPRGQQTITTMNLEGEVLKYDWAGPLQRPTGMEIYDDKLYVVDRVAVSEISLEEGTILNSWKIPSPIFPNDIVISEEGTIYVSDNEKHVIFKLENNQWEEWLSEGLERPNGMWLEDNTIYWGNNGDFTLRAVNIETKESRILTSFEGTGIIDGIKRGKDGRLIVSDYMGVIYSVDDEGKSKVLLNTKAEKLNQADFEYIPELDLIIVPSLYTNTVTAYKYSGSQ